LRVTAGQFKIPFGTESLVAENLEIAIARSRAVNSLAPGRDTGVPGRDTGIQIAGSPSALARSGPSLPSKTDPGGL